VSQLAVTEQRRPSTQKLTMLDRLSGFSLKIFGGPARSVAGGMKGLRDEILKSNLRITPVALVSLSLLITTITAAVAVFLTILGFLMGFLWLSLSLVAPMIALLVSINAPRFSQSSRSYALENELPYLVGYMEVLSSGGVSPISTLRRVARMSELLPASSKEAKLILVDTDVFGLDPISALEKAARYNPNKAFSEFLYGYTTVLKTGGDAETYVHSKQKEIMDARSAKIRRTSDTIGTLAEAYVTVTAVLGISLFTLYQVQAIVSHNQSGIASLLLFAFVAIPLLSAVFIWLLDNLGTKQPYLDMRPYKSFALWAPVGGALFLVPLPLNLFLHSSLALEVAVFVPAVMAIRYARERQGLEAKLPDLIRDVAESRKIGLSPETSIENLGAKGYGRLTRPVKKMGAQLSWGLSLSRVISTFIRSVNSWLTKVVGALMLEVVDVGGGTVRSFSEMADFTRKINDLEAEKRATLRPYVFVTYMAGMMIVLTTFLMVYFITSSSTSGLGGATPNVQSGTVDLLLTAAVFESWIVGLVAGKMGEGSVSDGFKHSALLVVLSMTTVYVTSIFIKIPL
jgi:flagellar protein FlaJ